MATSIGTMLEKGTTVSHEWNLPADLQESMGLKSGKHESKDMKQFEQNQKEFAEFLQQLIKMIRVIDESRCDLSLYTPEQKDDKDIQLEI